MNSEARMGKPKLSFILFICLPCRPFSPPPPPRSCFPFLIISRDLAKSSSSSLFACQESASTKNPEFPREIP